MGIVDFPYRFSRSDIKNFTSQLFNDKRNDTDKMIKVFDNSMKDSRHFARPPEWFFQTHSFVEKNERYVKNASTLSVDAIGKCIGKIDAEFKVIYSKDIATIVRKYARENILAHLCVPYGFLH